MVCVFPSIRGVTSGSCTHTLAPELTINMHVFVHEVGVMPLSAHSDLLCPERSRCEHMYIAAATYVEPV